VIRKRYTVRQKKSFHGIRSAGRKFKVHHKNVSRWMKEEVDTIRYPHRPKYLNKKGQGRKLTYSTEIDVKLLEWVLEKREVDNIPISIRVI